MLKQNIIHRFSSKEELRMHIEKHVPIGIKPTRKTKYKFIFPFVSQNAREEVINSIIEGLLID